MLKHAVLMLVGLLAATICISEASGVTGMKPDVTVVMLDPSPASRAARAVGLPPILMDEVSQVPTGMQARSIKTAKQRLRAAGYYPAALTSDNYKLAKDVVGEEIEIAGIALLPHSMSGVGKTLCPHSVPSCRATCLATGAGWNAARPSATMKPRLARARALAKDPVAFAASLLHEVKLWSKRVRDEGVTPALRLNVYSDIPWEVIAPGLVEELATHVRLYDYTKIPGRRLQATALGYDLTLSYSGPAHARHAQRELAEGGKVAVVFHTPGRPDSGWQAPLPLSMDGYPVIDGDLHDARFLDPGGSVIGLRFKQMANRDAAADKADDFVLHGPWSDPGYIPDHEGGLIACGAPCSIERAACNGCGWREQRAAAI